MDTLAVPEVRQVEHMMRRLRNAWHNIVIHPVAGVLWLFGCSEWGDWVHGEPTNDGA